MPIRAPLPDESPPEWAVDEARRELYDVKDPSVIRHRAWQLARDQQERHDERHDEFDDPDQGGEG